MVRLFRTTEIPSGLKLNRMSNTRSLALPSIMVLSGPAPVMVTESRMSRSPKEFVSSPLPVMVRVYFPAGRMILSGPGLLLALFRAERRLILGSGGNGIISAVVSTL